MRSHALSSGRPANDMTGEAAVDATAGEVDSAAWGEWLPPPNTRPGTTANSPSPETGRVTDMIRANNRLGDNKMKKSMKLTGKLIDWRQRTRLHPKLPVGVAGEWRAGTPRLRAFSVSRKKRSLFFLLNGRWRRIDPAWANTVGVISHI